MLPCRDKVSIPLLERLSQLFCERDDILFFNPKLLEHDGIGDAISLEQTYFSVMFFEKYCFKPTLQILHEISTIRE